LYTYANGASGYNSDQCVACHQQEDQDWQKSDHFRAMSIPTNSSVIADFSNTTAQHFSQSATFFKKDTQFFATVKDSTGATSETFPIKYTFGHYPLQQYLVETKNGTLQVLPFAWDARTKGDGGQRWFHNYSTPIAAKDRLHWRQPLQNWNGMCADCHSDELKRNYNPVDNSFKTTFSGVNVGCVSCHGRKPKHPSSEELKKPTILGNWFFNEHDKTASWRSFSDKQNRDNKFMQTCFACHSLRAPLTDGFTANTNFLDNFSPQLNAPPNYFADGQIKEEVYVYGSFLQSKMHANQVNCLDCHNPHTMKLKIEGNGLCLQCHKTTEYNVKAHSRHNSDSAGAQCVNCHMPSKVFMGVDYRRDHSFKIPRPDLSDEFGTPNACVQCHNDKSNQWASDKLKGWHGEPKQLSVNENNLLKLRSGEVLSLQQQLSIANDTSLPAISRATAIEMLRTSQQKIQANDIAAFLKHKDELIRLAAARISNLLTPQDRISFLAPLLSDPLKAIRVAVVKHLVSLDIAEKDVNVYRRAFEELLIANENALWRGEGRVNQGIFEMQLGNDIGAQLAFKASTDIDPYFDVGYVNLADLYRAKQREDLVSSVLLNGMEKNPKSAELAYSYGLALVRAKNIKTATDYFLKAMKLQPTNPSLAYTYILALESSTGYNLAIEKLKALLDSYGNNQSLIQLGLQLSQKHQNKTDFDWFREIIRIDQ
jgi:predicted CXXCH cytochrome family protein